MFSLTWNQDLKVCVCIEQCLYLSVYVFIAHEISWAKERGSRRETVREGLLVGVRS